MTNAATLEEARRELVAGWDIVIPTVDVHTTYNVLLHALEERIFDLLQHNPRKLTSTLYILDISERRYLQALDQPTMQDRAHDLARAVLERETEKIAMRQRYAADQRENLPDTSRSRQ
jgi:hypothetical protein